MQTSQHTPPAMPSGGRPPCPQLSQQPQPPKALHDTFAQNSPAHTTSLNQGPVTPYSPVGTNGGYSGSPQQPAFPLSSSGQSPQILTSQASPQHLAHSSQSPADLNGQHGAELPPLRPVFGVSLEDLLRRDGSAVPMVVYQCLQAVDLFGLDMEGIYRLSGNAAHVVKLRSVFDNGISQPLSAENT